MAELSKEARFFLKNSKRELQNNDLKSLYSSLRYEKDDIQLEVSTFLYEMLGDKLFTYLSSIPKNFLKGSNTIRDIDLSNNIGSIGEDAFRNSSLQQISLNDGVEFIGDSAFKDCANLKAVNLGNVKIIKNEAFAGCTGLRQIYLPESVMMLGKNVFPENVIIKSPKRKAKSLRFPKNELEWYKKHLVLDSSQYEEEAEE